MVVCKNCGGYFTSDELARRRSPIHAWQLTPLGERVLAENAAAGHPMRACPTCGNFTLRGAGQTASGAH